MALPKLPRTRLNQIARRKLLALGIATRPGANDSTVLEGELVVNPPARLTNPMDGARIDKIQFVVEGHDHLRATAPPCLEHVPPQPFYDFDQLAQLLAQIQAALDQSKACVQRTGDRLAHLGLEVQPDPARLTVFCRLEVAGKGSVELEASGRGLFATRLRESATGRTRKLLGEIAVSLDEMVDRADLELELGRLIESEGSETTVTGPVAGADLSPATAHEAAGSKGVSLGPLTAAFGVDAVIRPGFSVVRELVADQRRLQFAVRHEEGDTFSARLVSGEGTIWNGRLSLDDFPGLEKFVSRLLGEQEIGTVSPPPASGKAGFDQEVGVGYQLPVKGEVWAMNLIVEEETEDEIRYVGVDIDGQPFGAPRVLPRKTFQEVFEPLAGGAFRLLAEVLEVQPGQVVYQRLNASRDRVGKPIRNRLAAFLANFTPEAASY